MNKTVKVVLEKDKDGTWFYVHIPSDVRQVFKQHEKRGIISVRATIGQTSWDDSILPWADGSGQVSVNRKIQAKEHLSLGDEFIIHLAPR